MIDTIKDLSTLTTIQEKVLRKLITKHVYCINDAVEEAKLDDQDTVDLDIGLGVLSIQMVGDSLKYKFIPSQELETSIKNTILEEQNLLEDALENSLVDKITNVYKDLI